jgi:hypothetical protein
MAKVSYFLVVSACGHRTLREEINLVRVEITFVLVEITMRVEITHCV